MACQSQRGLPLCLTNDHISSISASASPARSTSQATSAGFSVRNKAVCTDSSTASFFLSSRSTVLGQICKDRAVSRTPLALRLTLNLSHFVARKHWPRSSPSSLHFRAHRLQRREPLRGLLVPMATIFALLQTAIN